MMYDESYVNSLEQRINELEQHMLPHSCNIQNVTKERDILKAEVGMIARERDAYKKAKAENDERFQSEVAHLRSVLDQIYNHNEACRAVVIQYYGTFHYPLEAVGQQESSGFEPIMEMV